MQAMQEEEEKEGKGKKLAFVGKLHYAAMLCHAAWQSPEKISFITLLQSQAGVLYCATFGYIWLHFYILLHFYFLLYFAIFSRETSFVTLLQFLAVLH